MSAAILNVLMIISRQPSASSEWCDFFSSVGLGILDWEQKLLRLLKLITLGGLVMIYLEVYFPTTLAVIVLAIDLVAIHLYRRGEY